MKKIFSLFMAFIATCALWAGNVITYTATEKLPEATYASNSNSLYIYAFDASITSHTFSEGAGTITFDNEITKIGYMAFDGCSGLTTITLPESVTSIGKDAFDECRSLTGINIPGSVTSIGDRAFYGCNSLTSITIPKSVTSIDGNTFLSCPNITSIIVAQGNTAYDSREGCNAIIETATNTLIVGCKNTVIPNSVTSIGEYAFYGCSGLASITIPDGVESIEQNAFQYCRSLTSINIPESVTSIKSYAFSDCSGLSAVHITNFDKWCKISFKGSNPLVYAHNLYLNGELVTNVVIPNSVTSIGNCAFEGGSCLLSVTIPNSVTSIGYNAFHGCSNLKSITIPEGVTSIGNQAFSKCSSLTSITIPESVTSIEDDAFYDCSGLSAVHITNPDKWCEISFAGSSSNPLSYAHNLYLNGELVTNVTIPNSVTSINYTFVGGACLLSVTIPNSVTSIGAYAFHGCSNLKSIAIPEGVTSIEFCTFEGCSSLMSVGIPSGVTSIGGGAFHGCSSLTSITIPDGVMKIESSAFDGCSSLKSIKIPDNIISIPNNLCYGCSSLTQVILGSNVESIGEKAFYGCASLTSVNFPDGLKTIGRYAFSSYDGKFGPKLTSIILPRSLERIEMDAFYDYYGSIKNVTIYNTLKYQGGSVWGTRVTPDYTLILGPFDSEINSVISSLFYQKTPQKKLIDDVASITAGPTTAEIVVDITGYTDLPDSLSLDLEDAEYPLNHGVTHIYATGLKPNSKNEFRFYSKNEGEISWTDGQPLEVTTSALILKTENPKIVSAGSAIVAATTNISDIETNVGFEWRKTDAPAEMASKRGNAIIYNGLMEGKLQNLATTNYWKVRAYYQAADETEYYGDWVAFDPSDFSYFEPTVHTYTLSSAPTSNSVMVRGYVMTGTDNVTEQGFEYWFSAPKGIAQRIAAATPDSIYRTQANGQIMTAVLENLAYSTAYHCRAYAIAGGKTFYGEDVQFLTAEDPRPIVTLVLTHPENGSINMDVAGEYREGDSVTLIATPDNGYAFEAWSDGATDNPYTFVITEDMELTAVFVVGTDILNTELQSRTIKFLRDGQLLILRDGKTYNMQGAVVE